MNAATLIIWNLLLTTPPHWSYCFTLFPLIVCAAEELVRYSSGVNILLSWLSTYFNKQLSGISEHFFLLVSPALSNPRRRILADLLLLVDGFDFFFPPLYVMNNVSQSFLSKLSWCISRETFSGFFRLQQSDFLTGKIMEFYLLLDPITQMLMAQK